jgi:hypothetical protein
MLKFLPDWCHIRLSLKQSWTKPYVPRDGRVNGQKLIFLEWDRFIINSIDPLFFYNFTSLTKKYYNMNFRLFKYKGKEIFIDIDKIVVVNIASENEPTIINCVDQFIVTVDDSVDEIKEKIGVTRTLGGFKQAN